MTKPIDTNEPVQTTCGLKARIICTDRKSEFSIVAILENRDGTEAVWTFRPDGSGGYYTLINAPKRITGWVNIRKDTSGTFYFSSALYKTKEWADAVPNCADAVPNRTACIYVDFAEGERLE